jgi:predicted Zn-dependent peptidase
MNNMSATMSDEISLHTLPSGLRVVHRYCNSPVEYCGVAVNVGSRDEAVEHYGLAHFVEHTIFKGTQRRRSWHIINRMEAVGGELNAYTTKEETVLYSVFPHGNLTRAVDLISDLVISSQFPVAEIDREREVVADEINSYLDSPSEAVFDDFEDLIFAGSELGHNILGTTDKIAGFTSQVCRDYLSRHYNAANMVFFYMGSTRCDKVLRSVESHFASLPAADSPCNRIEPVEVTPFDIRRDIDTHQAHTIIGARLPGMYSPMRYPISLLSNILGGPGMNSLLNVALRERRGLVYTVESTTAMFTDAGALMIYFGCDPDDLKKCRKWVMNTIDSLANNKLSPRALDAAKKQYLGQLAVASENRDQMALAIGRSVLYHNRVASPGETRQLITDITADDLLQAAQLIASTNCSTLTLG